MASGGLAAVDLGEGRTAALPVLPISLDGKRTGGGRLRSAGADTVAVLEAIGMSAAEIAVLA